MHVNDKPSGLEIAMTYLTDPVSAMGPCMEVNATFMRPRIPIKYMWKTLITLKDGIRIVAQKADITGVTDKSGATDQVGMMPGTTVLDAAASEGREHKPPVTAKRADVTGDSEQAESDEPKTDQPEGK
jgi:hypothetical protein